MASLGDASLDEEDYCYLTTVGRVSGRPHEVEIWFTVIGQTLYMLAGGGERSDWVRNARKTPSVRVRIGARTFESTARILGRGAEDGRGRRAVAAKYRARGHAELDDWERDALVVAVALGVALL